MPKVLYMSYDGMTDPLGQSQVLPYLQELSKQGYKITLLSFEKKHRYTSERKIIEKISSEAGITWVSLFFTSRPPILSKMYDRWRMLTTAKKLHKKEKFDIIHCRSYISAEAGLILKRNTGTRFLFDMRGFWADEKVDCGQWNQKKFFYRKLYASYKEKEKQFLLHADQIVSLTAAGREYLLSQKGYENLSIEVIPCCADLQHFDFNRIDPQQTAKLKNELGIGKERKVITYLGSIGGWYMTNEMFAFYNELVKRFPEFVLLILTKDEPAKVVKEATAAGITPENIVVRYAKREDVPVYLSLSDASIFFIRPTFSKTASSPTKHAELMGMGIPVICNDIGDTGRIMNDTGTGLLVKDFSVSAYKEVIDGMPDLLALPKSTIREAAFKYFDLKVGSSKYLQLYKNLLRKN